MELERILELGKQSGRASLLGQVSGERAACQCGAFITSQVVWKMSRDVLVGIIPAIHEARRSCLAEANVLSEEQEVDMILSALTRLDALSCCNDLELSRQLKQILLSQIPIPQRLAEDEDSVIFGLQSSASKKNGLEAVRRQMLHGVHASLAHMIGVEDEQSSKWLSWQPCSSDSNEGSKKQKASGYFSLNFDDIPMFEPLETTLIVLRKPFPANIDGISSLFEMDCGELVEHPQWKELVDLLLRALISASVERSTALPQSSLTKVLLVHVRLMHGLQGQQAIDIALNLLKFCWSQWMRAATPPAKHNVANESGEQVAISVFLDAIETALPQLKLCDTRDCDSFVPTLFVLLAAGKLNHDPRDLLDVLDGRRCKSVMDLVTSKPLQTAVFASQAGLFDVIFRKLELLEVQLNESRDSELQNGSCGMIFFSQDKLHCLISLNALFIGLLKPVLKMRLLCELVCSGNVASGLRWDKSMTAIQQPKELLQTPAAVAPKGSNKFLFQFSSSSSIFPLLRMDDSILLGISSNYHRRMKSCTTMVNNLYLFDLFLTKSDEYVLKQLLVAIMQHSAHTPDTLTSKFILQSLLATLQRFPRASETLLPSFIEGMQTIELPRGSICDESIIELHGHLELFWLPLSDLLLQSQTPLSCLIPSWSAISQTLAHVDRIKCENALERNENLRNLMTSLVVRIVNADAFGIYSHFVAVSVVGHETILIELEIQGMLPRLTDFLLRSLLICCRPDVAGAWDDLDCKEVVSALVVIASRFGMTALTTSKLLDELIAALANELIEPGIWDRGSISCSMSLLIGLALSGFVEGSFELLARSSPEILAACEELGVTDVSSCFDDNLALLTKLESHGVYRYIVLYLLSAILDNDVAFSVLRRSEGSAASTLGALQDKRNGGINPFDEHLRSYVTHTLAANKPALLYLDSVENGLDKPEARHFLAACAMLYPDPSVLTEVLTRNSTVDFSAIVDQAISHLASTDDGVLLAALESGGYPVPLLARLILRKWFMGVLSRDDVMSVTAATILEGPLKAAKVLTHVLRNMAMALRGSSHRYSSGAEAITISLSVQFSQY